MRVYNLTKKPLDFRGRTIPPNGGSLEYPDGFLPNRDLELARKGILAFGGLPPAWMPEGEVPVEPEKPPARVRALDVESVVAVETKAEIKVPETAKRLK